MKTNKNMFVMGLLATLAFGMHAAQAIETTICKVGTLNVAFNFESYKTPLNPNNKNEIMLTDLPKGFGTNLPMVNKTGAPASIKYLFVYPNGLMRSIIINTVDGWITIAFGNGEENKEERIPDKPIYEPLAWDGVASYYSNESKKQSGDIKVRCETRGYRSDDEGAVYASKLATITSDSIKQLLNK